MSDRSERLTRRQQRLSEKNEKRAKATFRSTSPTTPNTNLQLKPIHPITDNQILAFNAYEDGKHVCMLGSAGTGKSFVALYNALKDVLDKSTPYRRVVIIRTAQASKAIGFLPGTEKDKIAVFETAYKGIFAELFGRGDAYEVCKQKGIVEFTGTSFLRGTTINDAIVVVDEIQSMNFHEIGTIVTRLGNDAKLVICGDNRQDDLTSKRFNERSGIVPMIKLISLMPSIELITFTVNDIVRSGLVKEWILAYEESGVDPDEYR